MDRLIHANSSEALQSLPTVISEDVVSKLCKIATDAAEEDPGWQHREGKGWILVINRAANNSYAHAYPYHVDTSRTVLPFGGGCDGMCVPIVTLVAQGDCEVLLPITCEDISSPLYGKWTHIIKFPVPEGGAHGLRWGARHAEHAIHFISDGDWRYSINLRLGWHTLAEGTMVVCDGEDNIDCGGLTCSKVVASILLFRDFYLPFRFPYSLTTSEISSITEEEALFASSWLLSILIENNVFESDTAGVLRSEDDKYNFSTRGLGHALLRMAVGSAIVTQDPSLLEDVCLKIEIFDAFLVRRFQAKLVGLPQSSNEMQWITSFNPPPQPPSPLLAVPPAAPSQPRCQSQPSAAEEPEPAQVHKRRKGAIIPT